MVNRQVFESWRALSADRYVPWNVTEVAKLYQAGPKP